MLLFVVSAVFAVLALAGIARVFLQGQFATVDGLFFTGILALIAAVFGANAAYEWRAWRRRRMGTTAPAEKPAATAKPSSATASTAPKPVASAGAASAAAQPAAEKPAPAQPAIAPSERPAAQIKPEAKPVAAPAPVAPPKPVPAPKPASAEDQYTLAPGALLVQEGMELPQGVAAAGQPFVSGWRLMERGPAEKFRRDVEAAGWHVMYVAAQPEAGAWGRTREQAEQRAFAQLLAEIGKHNAFEIARRRTRKRFGLFHVTLAGHARPVQKSPFLFERPAAARQLFSVAIATGKREEEVRAA